MKKLIQEQQYNIFIKKASLRYKKTLDTYVGQGRQRVNLPKNGGAASGSIKKMIKVLYMSPARKKFLEVLYPETNDTLSPKISQPPCKKNTGA